jgi:hypothetical protein
MARAGHIQFCVEVDTGNTGPQLDSHRDSAAMLIQLLELFNTHQIAATWAVAPEQLYLAEQHLVDSHPHEIALLASSSWTGASVSRAEMQRRLPLVLGDFQDRALSVQSVVVGSCLIDEHRDLLRSNGIRAIRESPTGLFVTKALRRHPQQHEGVWSIYPSAQCPGNRTWLGRIDPGYELKRLIFRSLAGKALEHVSIPLSRLLAQDSARELKSLDRVLKIAAKLQGLERLRCESLVETMNGWEPKKNSEPKEPLLTSAA